MQLARPVCAQPPHRFGRGPLRDLALPSARPSAMLDDAKLFAATFLVGFVFVSVFIA